MQKGIASSFAAMGMAAAIVLPSAFVAHGRSDRADTSALSISESVDRADARIADLKANLRLAAAPPIADEVGNVDARPEPRTARAVIRSRTTSRRCGARPTRSQRSPRTCGKPPTQPSRSTTRSMTGNAGGSCMMLCGRTKWTIHATGAADLLYAPLIAG